MTSGRQEFDAVVLAGGTARRLGGIDKPGVSVGGRTLVAIAVRAAQSARTIVVVGPSRPELVALRPAGTLLFVREEPPGAGPVAALRRGIAEVSAPWTALLAADLPFVRAGHLRELLRAAGADQASVPAGPAACGAVLVDDSGRPQWLFGCWQTAVLRAAVRACAGRSLGGLLAPLRPAELTVSQVPGEPPPWLDCDSPEDLRRARAWPAPPRR